MAKDQTSEETLDEETSEETAQQTPTAEEATPELKDEEKVDYKVKFVASQQEALRLKRRAEELEQALKATQGDASKDKTEEKPQDLDVVVDRKLQERIAPLVAEQERRIVDEWLNRNPEAADYLEKIEKMLPKVPGQTTSERLENAFIIAKKDAMRQAGKKELAFSLYQQSQAVASGGGASSTQSESIPALTSEEKKVARNLGISEEAYAKRKYNK